MQVTASAPSAAKGPSAAKSSSAAKEKSGETDFSFTLSSWNQGIDPYSLGITPAYESNPTLAHTVFDRPLFRAGETVSMKHFLRRHSVGGRC